MPPAVAITMPSAQTSPLPPVRGIAAPRTSDPTADFGKLLREKTGVGQVFVPAIAIAGPMSNRAPTPGTDSVAPAGNPGPASAGTLSVAAAFSSPAETDSSLTLPSSQLEDGNASQIATNLTAGVSHGGSLAELSVMANPEPQGGQIIASHPRKLPLPVPSERAHKARPSAEVAAKTDSPNTPKDGAVSISISTSAPTLSTLISPVQQPAASSVAGPPTPNKFQSSNAAATQKRPEASAIGNAQVPSAPHDAPSPSVETSQSVAGSHVGTAASNPDSNANTVESAAPPKEVPQISSTGAHNLFAPHTSAAQSGETITAPMANVALSPGPAQAHSNNPVVPALPHPDSPAAAAGSATSPPAAFPNLYDRIDQGSAPALLHSGAQHVAVGIRDPDLGWVEIKTQNLAGHVDATLVTASGQTHATLAAQLPAISDFLHQRDVRLASLAVHHQPPGISAGSSQSGGTGNGPGAENPNQAGSGNPQGSGGTPYYIPVSRAAPVETAALGQDGTDFRPVSYISVRA